MKRQRTRIHGRKVLFMVNISSCVDGIKISIQERSLCFPFPITETREPLRFKINSCDQMLWNLPFTINDNQLQFTDELMCEAVVMMCALHPQKLCTLTSPIHHKVPYSIKH